MAMWTVFSDGMVSGSPVWLRTPATLNVRSNGVRPHSIWNQILIGLPLGRPVGECSASRRSFMGWPAPPAPSALRCRTDPEGEERTMAIAVLGIDLGKNSCSVAGLDGTGRVVLRRRLTRESVVRLAGTLPACVVAMEACCGAHHLGRVLREQGHEVRLMSPESCSPTSKPR